MANKPPHRKKAAQKMMAVLWACAIACNTFLATASTQAALGHTKLRVVATTTLMAAALKEVGGRDVAVTVILPGGSCPGHYDLKPTDVYHAARSAAVFAHGYEAFLEQLMKRLPENCKPRLCRISVEGNWLVPKVFARATQEVADQLGTLSAAHAEAFRRRSRALQKRLVPMEQHILRRLEQAGAKRTSVLCATHQTEFLKWLGFNVVGQYGRPEDLTPTRLHELASAGRRHHVKLVVDNLQSGPGAGKSLAAEIGAVPVTLSNFPGGFPNTQSWQRLLQENVWRVLNAMEQYRKEANQRKRR